MRLKKTIFFLLFIFVLLQLSSFSPSNKDDGKLRLIHADISQSIVIDGAAVRILHGNVYLRQDSLHFWCDSAVYYKNIEKSTFFGNVKINKGREKISADRIDYFRLEKKAVAQGKVWVRQPEKWLKSSHFTYYFKTKSSFARKNVQVEDSLNQTTIWCDELDYFPSEDKSVFRVGTIVHKFDDKNKDTLKILCDTLVYFSSDSSKKMFSYGNVKFYQQKIKAVCDSASYFVDDEIIKLNSDPVVYQDNNEMRGERIEIFLKNQKPERIFIWKHSELHSVLDSATMKEDVLKGHEIFITFEDDSIRQVLAKKNAIGRYHVTEGDDKGLNYITADSLILFIKKNKVDSIYVAGGAEGTYYPADKMENAP